MRAVGLLAAVMVVLCGGLLALVAMTGTTASDVVVFLGLLYTALAFMIGLNVPRQRAKHNGGDR